MTALKIVIALALTLFLEGAVLAALGHKSAKFWLLFVIFNAVTNLSVSFFWIFADVGRLERYLLSAVLEAAAVVIEFFGIGITEKRTKAFFVDVLLANAVSLTVGSIIFSLIF